jgi:hypothetical protein
MLEIFVLLIGGVLGVIAPVLCKAPFGLSWDKLALLVVVTLVLFALLFGKRIGKVIANNALENSNLVKLFQTALKREMMLSHRIAVFSSAAILSTVLFAIALLAIILKTQFFLRAANLSAIEELRISCCFGR